MARQYVQTRNWRKRAANHTRWRRRLVERQQRKDVSATCGRLEARGGGVLIRQPRGKGKAVGLERRQHHPAALASALGHQAVEAGAGDACPERMFRLHLAAMAAYSARCACLDVSTSFRDAGPARGGPGARGAQRSGFLLPLRSARLLDRWAEPLGAAQSGPEPSAQAQGFAAAVRRVPTRSGGDAAHDRRE